MNWRVRLRGGRGLGAGDRDRDDDDEDNDDADDCVLEDMVANFLKMRGFRQASSAFSCLYIHM